MNTRTRPGRISAALIASLVVAPMLPAQIMPDWNAELRELKSLLGSDDAAVRLRAAKGVMRFVGSSLPELRIGPPPFKRAEAVLREAMASADPSVRLDAARTLVRAGYADSTSREIVRKSLVNGPMKDRAESASALLARDVDVDAALVALGNVASGSDAEARVTAVVALRDRDRRRGRGEPAATQLLRRALVDPTEDVRICAVSTLLETRDGICWYDAATRADALAVATRLLERGSRRGSTLAISAVLVDDTAPLPPDAVPFLTLVLRKTDFGDSWQHRDAIKGLGRTPPGAGAEATLLQALPRMALPERIAIIDSLVRLDPPKTAEWRHAASAEAVLRDALDGDDHLAEMAAHATIGTLGPAAAPFVDALVDLLDRATHSNPVLTLTAIGPPARPALPRLRQLAEQGRRDAPWAIAAIAPDEAARWIRAWLAAYRPERRTYQDLEPMQTIGSDRAARTLLVHTTDDDIDVRHNAFKALAVLEPPIDRTVVAAAITRGLRDEDARVRAAAAALSDALRARD